MLIGTALLCQKKDSCIDLVYSKYTFWYKNDDLTSAKWILVYPKTQKEHMHILKKALTS